jgi:predicted nucleic acid-binding protein
MPPAYVVRAVVVDIRGDAPRPSDRFLVDTNVWAWARYFRSAYSASGFIAQVGQYVPYFRSIAAAGAIRYRTGLTYAELARLIEANEHDGYSVGVGPLPPKDYRHNVHSERARVVAEIERVWGLVRVDSELLPLTLDDAATDAAQLRLGAACLDASDALMLGTMLASGVSQILTDDGDFCTVAGIEVFTANARVLSAAAAQGRLLVR